MIKFSMPYFDVLFPVNLGPLTYECPAELVKSARPGMLVSAPLRNRITKGILLSENVSPPAKVKQLCEFHGETPVLGENLLGLIKWMSDYYLAPPGLVLKQTVPDEVFKQTRYRKVRKGRATGNYPPGVEICEADFSSVIKSLSSFKYRTFMLHSPSVQYEYTLVSYLLRASRNAIILTPEIVQATAMYNRLKGLFGERVCILHSGISGGQRSESLEGIVSGRHDIVVGTRSALFVPLPGPALIVVLHEHSSSYKLEEGTRYNIRDVAVMRGFMEKSTVLLSSVTPSIDSYYNALSKKYVLIKPSPGMVRPKTRIIDMRFAKKISGISKEIIDSARAKIKSGKRILFLINRRGHSTLLQCSECGLIETCTQCKVPLVMHKDKKALKCHYCGTSYAIPVQCSRCRGTALELLGTGTQKIQETLEGVLGIRALRLDSDAAGKVSVKKEILADISSGSAVAVVATKMVMNLPEMSDKFSMAAVMNVDSALNFPDFRASEKAYMELSSLAELVSWDGEILVQTRFPQNSLFRYFRENAYSSFVKEELQARRELGYPPYAKLLNIVCPANAALAAGIIAEVKEKYPGIDILGPAVTRNRRGEEEFSIMLKSSDKTTLRSAARELQDKTGRAGRAGIRLDIDPY